MMSDQKLLLSISEAASRLGIGKDRAYELVRSGKLASISNGTRNRKVPVAALEEYVQNEMSGGK